VFNGFSGFSQPEIYHVPEPHQIENDGDLNASFDTSSASSGVDREVDIGEQSDQTPSDTEQNTEWIEGSCVINGVTYFREAAAAATAAMQGGGYLFM
jgi:hypothetical protein